jgi:SAM-dependent methyltransferase
MDHFESYARFYDLDYAGHDADLQLYQQFADRCGSPILELGCGTGRLVVPLALQGHTVTGVDNSPAMLDLARQAVDSAGVGERVTLVEQDMRSLELETGFNLAIAATNTFMHLLALDDQLDALAAVRRHLAPDGLLILDLLNPDPGRLTEPAGQWHLAKVMTDPVTGHTLTKTHTQRVDLARQIIHVTLIVDKVGDDRQVLRTLFPFSLRYLFRAELELLFRHAGYRIESLYGSYELDDFTGESERLIAVARPNRQPPPDASGNCL